MRFEGQLHLLEFNELDLNLRQEIAACRKRRDFLEAQRTYQ